MRDSLQTAMQIYLIARITPQGKPLSETKYRCIAALQHEWCYGRLPLEAAARFITLIKQKENAEIIREEIHGIHGLYGIFGTLPELPDVPCPFAHFLMQSAWTSDFDDPKKCYGSNTSYALPASMNTFTSMGRGRERDDHVGITIIDVTNPESPAYCFVSIDELECEDGSNISIMTLHSSTQYVCHYYPQDDSETPHQQLERSVLNTLCSFESVPMITIDMLAEAWPGEYMPTPEPSPSGLSLEPKGIYLPPSLVELTFLPALNYALQTGETDLLDPLMLLPGNVSRIKENLRARNSLSPVAFALLSKVIAIETQNKSIDLSHFSLTGEQLIKLLSVHKGVEVLNISHMQQITADILRQLIPILPNLRRLVLLHTLPDADVLSLLSESPELFYRIESPIHLAFLRPLGQAAFPAAFSHITKDSSEVSIVSLPYFTPDQLVQALTDYTSCLHAGSYAFLTTMRYELPLMTTYASAVREPGRSWSERIVPFIPGRACKQLKEHEGWFLAWSALVSLDPWSPPFHYAFARVNKEALEEYHRRMDELKSLSGKFKLESLRAKENIIKSKYADQQFDIFDVESFFLELVKEGRPAPSPEGLSKLLELFATLKEVDKPRKLCIMTQADLNTFLENTQYMLEEQ